MGNDLGVRTSGYVYDLDVLKRGLESINVNIESLKKGLEQAEVKRQEYMSHIAAAEAIIALHRIKDGNKDGDPN